ncbi:MAG TPA: TetR/AcrR family transcriptional regulator [Leptospiraceae bacterium]|nr:TetR/AcrR family transcriptional regulator [Leptospiraceae bacterium]HNF15213.1 TetR/AcrR family transcriptional regulator [Leptospiraceae bacterium]HNF24637.1 TetR/AcrR family transcriptional regulator [Leptospiraceae bacterium]HNO22017.1 TetR/AcrR family transcriptional regulator [Leptospiraceae bacterium]
MTCTEIREKAIEYAEERIRRLGFEKIRLIDVAKDLGISHAALYQHFPDKAALLESVTEKWLMAADSELETVIKQKKTAAELIVLWFLSLHRIKRKKVSLDPELFKAFDTAAEENKGCIQKHLSNAQRQLSDLVSQAMKEGSIKKDSVPKTVEILFLGTIAFHYPKLVALNLQDSQEQKLRSVVNALLSGLK